MKKVAFVMLALFASLTMQSALAADIEAGAAAYNGRGCIGCHGVGGKSQVDIYPTLVGKSTDYVVAELEKFRSKERVNPTMNAMAASLSDQDIADIAAYLASQ